MSETAFWQLTNEQRRCFGIAPVERFTTSPFLTTIRVGTPAISKRVASSGSSSTLIFTTLMSSRSAAISSISGTTRRQGPHQGAQKSRSTGTVLFIHAEQIRLRPYFHGIMGDIDRKITDDRNPFCICIRFQSIILL